MRIIRILLILTLLYSCCHCGHKDNTTVTESSTGVWVPDQGDGTYRNPVLYADYSDPDVINVDGDFYLTSSSFNCVPGLPLLHSTDLVNWQIIGHVFARQQPDSLFSIPQHGNGVWAPSIRYHKGNFYIFYGDPDYGIYMTKAKSVNGPWSRPLLIRKAKGWIDPCPLWDDDGKAYLVHAFAGSRAGIKSILVINKMDPEGTRLLDDGVLVYDGHDKDPTVEGPKIYKRHGYYYIFAPAGGVTGGWQLVLRSRNIYGPYERKVVLHQGNTNINGPHQGAWVETQKGESWFLHFQDMGAYGRVVYLEPMHWKNDWPQIGVDQNNDGIGEPVAIFKKPGTVKASKILTPQTSDDFNKPVMGLQWQWSANPEAKWGFPSNEGFFRLNAVTYPRNSVNMWDVPNLFLQKFAAPSFTATAKMLFYPKDEEDRAGLIIMGTDYAYLSVQKRGDKWLLKQSLCYNADKGQKEIVADSTMLSGDSIFYFRVKVMPGAIYNFSYSSDDSTFIPIGRQFSARPGRWIGAKIGFFCLRKKQVHDAGYADIDWFRIMP